MFRQLGFGLGRAWTSPLVIATFFAACFLWPGPVWAETGSGCVRVEVSDPIRLPDGRLYPAGSLTLCDSMQYSPVSSLHKTYVNGQAVGVLTSRRRASEMASNARPTVLFQRNGQGQLELVGYVLPGPRRSVTYQLAPRMAMPRHAVDVAETAQPPNLVAMAATTSR